MQLGSKVDFSSCSILHFWKLDLLHFYSGSFYISSSEMINSNNLKAALSMKCPHSSPPPLDFLFFLTSNISTWVSSTYSHTKLTSEISKVESYIYTVYLYIAAISFMHMIWFCDEAAHKYTDFHSTKSK